MEQFVGVKYRLKSSENFEDYLKFIDIGLISRKTAISLTPVCLLTDNHDGSFTFSMSTTFRSTKFSFRPGEQFTEERADGAKVQSVMEIEGDKLIQTQIEENGRKSTHVRHFTRELLTTTSTAEGWNGKCIRIYEAVN